MGSTRPGQRRGAKSTYSCSAAAGRPALSFQPPNSTAAAQAAKRHHGNLSPSTTVHPVHPIRPVLGNLGRSTAICCKSPCRRFDSVPGHCDRSWHRQHADGPGSAGLSLRGLHAVSRDVVHTATFLFAASQETTPTFMASAISRSAEARSAASVEALTLRFKRSVARHRVTGARACISGRALLSAPGCNRV
jgi:hypothetical protein